MWIFELKMNEDIVFFIYVKLFTASFIDNILIYFV